MGRIAHHQELGEAILTGLKGSPEWIRDHMASKDTSKRMVAEEALTAYLVNRLKVVEQQPVYHDAFVGRLVD